MGRRAMRAIPKSGTSRSISLFSSMRLSRILLAALALAAVGLRPAAAFDRPEVTFKVFQFPADQIPRVDGDASDWAMVPESYVVDGSQLQDVEGEHLPPDPK